MTKAKIAPLAMLPAKDDLIATDWRMPDLARGHRQFGLYLCALPLDAQAALGTHWSRLSTLQARGGPAAFIPCR
jgi:hypothetical protein